ncbi:hypothetical protein BJY00DRAFT_295123 [Aspergillus carlsbadensis]|nr:hypothetical protein BJY00DRAFT_295123 [Aspergillus carlsbadensis]
MRLITMILTWLAVLTVMALTLPTEPTHINETGTGIAFENFGATTADLAFPIQLLALDPSSMPSEPADTASMYTELANTAVSDNTKQDNPYWDVQCDPKGYGEAEVGVIRGAIKHLRKQKGDTLLQPNHCTRLYCKHHSAVIWCNVANGQQEITLKSMGDATSIIFQKCEWHFGRGPTTVAGILRHVDGFQVIVKEDHWKC